MTNKVSIVLDLSGVNSAVAGFSKVDNSTKALGRSLKNVGDKGIAFGTKMTKGVVGGLTAAGTAAFAFTKKMTDAGNRIDKTAASANISAESFQKVQFALGQISQASEQDVSKALQTLNKRLGDATNGNAMYQESLMQLGFSMAEIESGTIDTQTAFDRMTKVMPEMESASQAAAVAAQLLGANVGKELGPAIRRSGGDVEALGRQLEATGGVMSNDMVAQSAEFTDQLSVLQKQFGGVAQEMLTGILPVMSDHVVPFISGTMIPAIKDFVNFIGGLIDAFQSMPGPVKQAVGVVAAALGAAGPIVLALGALTKVMGVFLAGSGPIGLFILAASALVAAWSAWGDDIKAIFRTVTQFLGGLIFDFTENAKRVWKSFLTLGFLETAKRELGNIKMAFTSSFDAIRQFVTNALGALSNAFDFAVQKWTAAIERVKSIFTSAKDAISGTATGIKDSVVGSFQSMYDTLVGNSIVPDLRTEVVENFRMMGVDVNKSVSEANVLTLDNFKNLNEGTTTQTAAMYGNVADQTGTWADGMLGLFGEFGGAWGQQVGTLSIGTTDGFNNMATTSSSNLTTWFNSLLGDDGLGGFVNSWLGGIGGLVDGTMGQLGGLVKAVNSTLRSIARATGDSASTISIPNLGGGGGGGIGGGGGGGGGLGSTAINLLSGTDLGNQFLKNSGIGGNILQGPTKDGSVLRGKMDFKKMGLNLAAGVAGSFAGNELGEAIFGKEAESGIGAGLGGIIGGTLGGPLGTLIGSTLGAMVDVAAGGDGFKRSMVGFLGAPTPGAPGSSKFGVDPFASGFMPTGFADAASRDAAQSIISQFRAIDETITALVRQSGGMIDMAGATLGGFGIDGSGSGTFFGRTQRTTDSQFKDQLKSFASQVIDHARNVPPEVMESLRAGVSGFARGGSFVTNGPRLIGVGENGMERVSVTPVGGRRARGGQGINIIMTGTTIFDQITMTEFERRIATKIAQMNR